MSQFHTFRQCQKIDFHRTDSLIWMLETDQEKHNFQTQSEFIVFQSEARFGHLGAPGCASQNTRIYDENCIFSVISRRNKTELASLSQGRLATNSRSRKSLQNLCEIEHFDVFEVANASTFLILDRFCSVFWTS